MKKIIVITAVFFVFFLVLGLVGQAVAQPKIEGSHVSYTAGGVEMIGYLAYDAAMPIAYNAQADKQSWDELSE